MIACECAANWRVELVELTTGQALVVIIPLSFEFETDFLLAGRGSITFHRKGVGLPESLLAGNTAFLNEQYIPLLNMYPKRMGIYISRLAGGAATPLAPVPMFGGIVDTLSGTSAGFITLGFTEIQSYLDTRLIRSDLVFTAVDQTDIAEQLVLYARGENTLGGSTDPETIFGIELYGDSNPTIGTNRDRTYLAKDRPFIGEMLRQLIGVLDGPVYQMSHVRGAGGIWTSTMEFYDEIPQTVVKTISAANLTDFSVNLEGKDIGNLADAMGAADLDGVRLIATNNAAGDLAASMPRYDATPVFDTVSDPVVLQSHAFGYTRDHYDVAAQFQFMFSGLEYGGPNDIDTLDIGDLIPGNEVEIDVHSQNWRILTVGLAETVARIGRVAVSVPQEGTESVSIQVVSNNMSAIATQDGFFYPCVDC